MTALTDRREPRACGAPVGTQLQEGHLVARRRPFDLDRALRDGQSGERVLDPRAGARRVAVVRLDDRGPVRRIERGRSGGVAGDERVNQRRETEAVDRQASSRQVGDHARRQRRRQHLAQRSLDVGRGKIEPRKKQPGAERVGPILDGR